MRKTRPLLMVFLLLAGCESIGAAGAPLLAIPAAVEGVSLVTTQRGIGDNVVSLVTGQDCSYVRLAKGQTYCASDPPPPVQPMCTRSLGSPVTARASTAVPWAVCCQPRALGSCGPGRAWNWGAESKAPRSACSGVNAPLGGAPTCVQSRLNGGTQRYASVPPGVPSQPVAVAVEADSKPFMLYVVRTPCVCLCHEGVWRTCTPGAKLTGARQHSMQIDCEQWRVPARCKPCE